MKNIALFLILMLFYGCVTQKRCLSKYPPQSGTDSVYIEKLKEVPVYINGDTIVMKVPINCPDQDVAIYENVKLRQTIRILNGKLLASTEIKGDTIKIYVPQITEKTKEVIVTKPEKFTPKLILYSAIVTWVLLALVILWLLNKVFKVIKI